MNAAESADAVRAVSGAAGEEPCIDLDGSRVCAEVDEGGVLVVRVYPAGDTPTAVYVDHALVVGSQMDWRPMGRHHKRMS